MKRKLFITAALLCFVTICLAAMANLAGNWAGSIIDPDGNNVSLKYNFKIEGDKLTGTVDAQGDVLSLDSGKVSGNEFQFSVTNTQGVVIPHKGKYIASGDSCSLDIKYQDLKFHTKLIRGN